MNSRGKNSKRHKREVLTDQEMELRSYGTKLKYECGLARLFYNKSLNETYKERNLTCNWNTSWTKFNQLDPCVWVQCLYPPEPPAGTNLHLNWDGSPVNFTHNVSYTCSHEDLYFEWDKRMTVFNVTCLPGGTWNAPDIWPMCIKCKT